MEPSLNGFTGTTPPWLDIHLKAGSEWERTLTIRVKSEHLKSSPKFNYYWNELQTFQTTRTLTEQALLRDPYFPSHLFSKNITSPSTEEMQNEAKDFELEVLKFAFWHHESLGLTKDQFTQIVAHMSDISKNKVVENFIEWLHDKKEDELISQINASKSKLNQLFFRYLTPDTYHFDIHNFFEYLSNTKNVYNVPDEKWVSEYKDLLLQNLTNNDPEKLSNFLLIISQFLTDESLVAFLETGNEGAYQEQLSNALKVLESKDLIHSPCCNID